MGGNERVTRYELDLYRSDVTNRFRSVESHLKRLEEQIEQLDQEHDTDMDGLAQAAEERRKTQRSDRQWTIGQVVAVISALAALGTLWLAVIAR